MWTLSVVGVPESVSRFLFLPGVGVEDWDGGCAEEGLLGVEGEAATGGWGIAAEAGPDKGETGWKERKTKIYRLSVVPLDKYVNR